MKKYCFLLFILASLFLVGCSNDFLEKDQSLEIVSNFKKDLARYEDITQGQIFFQTGGLYYKVTGHVMQISDYLSTDEIRLSFNEFGQSILNQKYEILFKSLMRNYVLDYDYENSSSIQDADYIINGIGSPGYIVTYNNQYNTCQYVNSPSQDFVGGEPRGYKSDIQISCVKNTDIIKAIDEQKEFIEGLDIGDSRRDIQETYKVGENTFYILNLVAVAAIAQKDSIGNYKMIQITQSGWECEIMKENDIPQYIYKECYNR